MLESSNLFNEIQLAINKAQDFHLRSSAAASLKICCIKLKLLALLSRTASNFKQNSFWALPLLLNNFQGLTKEWRQQKNLYEFLGYQV